MTLQSIVDFFHSFSQALASGQSVQHWGAWTYLALSGLVLVEGPVATLLGAAAASAGFMDPLLVFASASLGNLTADMLWYGLGYLGKIEWVLRHGRWFGVRRAHIDRLTRDLHRHARKLLLVAKLTFSLAVPVLIATGVAKVPWRRWFYVVFLAEMLWTGSLVVVGYHFARSLAQLEAGLQVVAVVSVALFAFLIGRYLYRLAKVWSDLPDEDNVEDPEW
ncbi:MAG: VTT domain-containing protein [Anaerolineales bacterium]